MLKLYLKVSIKASHWSIIYGHQSVITPENKLYQKVMHLTEIVFCLMFYCITVILQTIEVLCPACLQKPSNQTRWWTIFKLRNFARVFCTSIFSSIQKFFFSFHRAEMLCMLLIFSKSYNMAMCADLFRNNGMLHWLVFLLSFFIISIFLCTICLFVCHFLENVYECKNWTIELSRLFHKTASKGNWTTTQNFLSTIK